MTSLGMSFSKEFMHIKDHLAAKAFFEQQRDGDSERLHTNHQIRSDRFAFSVDMWQSFDGRSGINDPLIGINVVVYQSVCGDNMHFSQSCETHPQFVIQANIVARM